MKEMSKEKVERFLRFLEIEAQEQWKARSARMGDGNFELAYHSKMKASQTEHIKTIFLQILNDDTE